MKLPHTALVGLEVEIGGHWEVSDENPFIMEWSRAPELTRPNWALIIPLAVILLASLIAVCVILYRKWRRDNCYPIYFAGKVRYGRKGVSIREACQNTVIFNDTWLKDVCHSLKPLRVIGLYTDVDLTQPLNEDQRLIAPLYIYPKLEK